MKANKSIKLLSTLLAVLMMVSAFTIIAGAEEDNGPKYTTNTGGKPTYEYKTTVIETAEEKIALMDYRYGTDKFELYVDAYSGEVAIRSKSTGEILFTNPYNIGKSTATASDGNTKDEIMSQLVVHYTNAKTDQKDKLYSYTWAATRNQISVMNIKGGIRVEYTIGREESKSLLPRMIEASAFEDIVKNIETNMEAAIAAGTVGDPDNARHKLSQFKSWYSKFCLDEAVSDEMYNEYITNYPILGEFADKGQTDFAIYVIDAKITETQIKAQEALIKEYYKEYTFQDLEEAHAFVKYEAENESYPLFKMALEYTLEDSGLVVRLPANGIRFDESLYRLDSIEILPYMGAGMNPNEGYTFFPDGSGTLFDFQKIALLGTRQMVTGKVYGQDFAYHEPSGQYEEVIRYPVFGIYEKEQLSRTVTDAQGNETKEAYEKDRGYVAIVEEGDALMELSSVHGGNASEYNTIRMSVYPRPTDSYNIADAISVGSNKEWTVVSARKYTGNYKVRYIMLTDNDVATAARAAGKTAENYYEPSYIGMATAYREYLSSDLKKVLTRLTDEDVSDSIPLYIESFGALKTTEKFLSIPIDVMTPLTTFEDVQTMYDDLKGSGITNVNFILKGFTKGGMTSPRVPYNLQWESAVSKEMDFEELNKYAKDNDFGLFPDFDFVFSSSNTLFDGLTLNKHAAKTIDNRYTSKREYSATKHTYVSYYELALSPAYFSHFYEKFIPKYEKTSPVGISVSSLGSYLNSDFDEDDPYNRADGQKYTEKAFAYIESELADTEIMTSGGNAYSWKYVDHITDIALDSSRFSIASASVPFLGMVLHGSVEIAGTPVNMEGNIEYAILKAIESGAALKFILSYRNTEKLKDYETLSKYYSVDYSIWYNDGEGDLITMYNELNAALKDVQTSIIVDHEYVSGIRVPDDDELVLDAEQAIKDAIAYETALENANSESERKAIYEARQLIIKGSEALKNAIDSTGSIALVDKLEALKAIYNGTDGDYDKAVEEVNKALEAYEAVQQFHAIYSDYVGTGTKYKVEDAIAAYEAYKEDPTNKADWDEFVEILGKDYADTLVKVLEGELDEEELDVIPAGVAVDVDKAIAAMKALAPIKAAFIEEYSKATDNNKKKDILAAYEANVKTIYAELLESGVVYEITYGDKKIEGTGYYGGSRYYRDAAKYEYDQAITKLNVKLEAMYSAATKVLEEQEKLCSLAELKAAIKLLEEKGAYSDDERARLAGIVDEVAKKFEGKEDSLNAALDYDVVAKMTEAYGKYEALYNDAADAKTSQGSFDPVKDYNVSDMTSLFVGKTFTWNGAVSKNDSAVSVARPEANTKKYESDDNMIVHETFDNGKEFLLNFNDYRVVVELDGKIYTIDAYGYIVVKNVKA